jgi:cyclase
VRTLEDAQRLLSAGADKVAVNTAAVESPETVNQIAEHFGRQALVVAIDARRRVQNREVGAPLVGAQAEAAPKWRVSTYGGSKLTELDAVAWAREVEARGAGEILLTSMDADGTQAGFDCELTKTIADALHIPVIASGGAGGPEHVAEVFLKGHADAALAASIFHFETYTMRSLKGYLRSQGVPVRL